MKIADVVRNRWATTIGFVLVMAAASAVTRETDANARREASGSRGYVLQPGEGEALMGKNLILKVSSQSGSSKMVMAVQRMAPNMVIPPHIHQRADEIVFVHSGNGSVTVGDAHYNVVQGSTIYIPAGVWHGFTAAEVGMEGLGVASQPGLDGFFRDLDRATNSGARELSIDELNKIGRKYGDVYRAQR